MFERATTPATDRGGAADGAGSDTSPSQSTRRTVILDTRSGSITFGVAPTLRPRGGTIPLPGNVSARAARRSVQPAYTRAALRAQHDYYYQCLTCWRTKRDTATRSDTWAAGYADGLRAGRAERCNAGLDNDLIMAAIRLCHPDRHPVERHADANKVTAALLELRTLAEVGR
jgi:hypothetical protein